MKREKKWGKNGKGKRFICCLVWKEAKKENLEKIKKLR